jgi:hypothetical protein
LHQALSVPQAIKRMGIITLVGRDLRLPEKSVQDTFIVAVQTVIEPAAKKLAGALVLALAERQSPAAQRDAPQQWRRSIRLSNQSFMNVRQQMLRSQRGATLFQQLRKIKLQQTFKQQ